MPNRLADSLSPYLRQHAHNPVDWYPWGAEALARAEELDRPILLSVGYSACHWCHVMERESFDDPETAALMNERFVCIKVDREERPDLDQIYQLVVQLMRKRGGWPLTVFLTPAREPYFGGTYFPPEPRHGMPDFRTVLHAAHDAWTERQGEVTESAAQITRAIAEVTSALAEPAPLSPQMIERAAAKALGRADRRHGGFGARPKFPSTMALELLLRSGQDDAVSHALASLDAMARGGVYDQLGGGFHRYSTDERWLVPHFEKMLYDNAMLLRLYADAHRLAPERGYDAVIRQTVGYLEREMRAPSGLFYATQDADSEGEEGRFFVWTPAQIREALEPADAEIALAYWGVTDAGNFEGTGASVLHVNRPARAVAEALERPLAEVEQAIERARARLFEVRERREKPFRDDKHIAAWNGLAIGALAEAGAALGERAWVDAARDALGAARDTLWHDGALRRVSMEGEVRVRGFLEDYAHLAGAALDVHRASLDDDALAFARALVDAAVDRFWDDAEGGFCFAAEADDLIVRAKDVYDNATPSGTSSMAHAMLRLAALSGDAGHRERAERALARLAEPASGQPMGFGHLLGAVDHVVRGPVEVVVVAAEDEAAALLTAARSAYEPDLVLARAEPGSEASSVGAAAARTQRDGRPTAYVCRGRACSAPVTEPDALAELVRRSRPR